MGRVKKKHKRERGRRAKKKERRGKLMKKGKKHCCLKIRVSRII